MAAAAIRCAHAGVIPWVPHASSVSSNEAKAELDAVAALDEAEDGVARSCCRTPPDANFAFLFRFMLARCTIMLARCTKEAAAESDNMPGLSDCRIQEAVAD